MKINKLKNNIFLAAALSLAVIFTGCGKTPASKASSAISTAVSAAASSAETSSAETSSAEAVSAVSSSAVSSSAPDAKAKPSSQYDAYVTLTIDASKGGDGIVAGSKQVGLNAGDTVYTLLKRYCGANKILLSAQKTGNGEYVTSIDGVAQFNAGPQSGWIYSVNGAFPQSDCNACKLSGGEKIKWIYTTDLGKSEGSK